MADPFAPQSIIQNSLAAGEIAPGLYGRTDLAKFHQSALLARNWFVDYKGGMSTRPGTQYIGTPGSAGYARIYPFKFSAAIGQTYILVFSDLKLEFIKNPGGTAYPNSSNSGFILSGGVHYTVVTPYTTADLPSLKFSQVGDVLRIAHRNYSRRKLVRTTDTNWTLSVIGASVGPAQPTVSAVSISALPAGSSDPQTTRYIYAVSAVDAGGNEGSISVPFVTAAGINITVTQGTVSVFWGAVTSAVYYRIYKGLPSFGNIVPPLSQQLGFCGFSYGTSFVDGNIVPDFTSSPTTTDDPFAVGAVNGYTITASGAGYPVGGTTFTMSGGGPGTGAVAYPILDNNTAAGTGTITGVFIAARGSGYTGPITLTAVGGGGAGFAGTLTIGPQTGVNPGTTGLFQQRQIYAATANKPSTVFGSRPGQLDDFRKSNPIVPNDSFEFDIASSQVNTILWLLSMPGGLVIGTDAGVVQLTGGSSSATNPTAVTAESGIIVPQSYYGSADISPIIINYDILYVQNEGSIVRDLQYNFFVNIYTGTDITQFSNHLFYPNTIIDWAYQDTPFKVVWCLLQNGKLLSLTYLKEQEVLGWTQHETGGGGIYESIAVIQEGSTDAVYYSVNRNGSRCIERLCDRLYYQRDDAWCLDAALSIVPTYPAANVTFSATTGNITVTASAGVFSLASVGGVIRISGGKATITGYTSTTVVSALVNYELPVLSYNNGAWRLDPLVSTLGGLSHLNGLGVYALVDGVMQGPFTVSGGSVTLTTPGTSVVVGLLYICQLQPVFTDITSDKITTSGKRLKVSAVTIRQKDSWGLKFGPDFNHLKEFVVGTSGTDPAEKLPYITSGLVTGDQRLYINADYNRIGSVCIEQDYPLPATVLAIIPEVVQGDTR